MKSGRYSLSMFLAISMFCCLVAAQQGATTSSSPTVPRLVNFTGKTADAQGKPIAGIAGVTFAIYKEQYEGAPLWLETQNVQADAKGNYTVQLGATKPDGLPLDLFTSGEARWLGVTVNGGQEQPRILLLSVPYALKAADAETIGGLPPSAFVLADKAQGTGTSTRSAPASTASASNTVPPANRQVTGKGTLDFIPMWDTTSDIINSLMFQKSSQIGINTTSPAATLDVNGNSDVRDTLTLFPKGTDSTLAVNGTAFKVDQTGKVTFVSGQTFPGTGPGTITGITTAVGSGLAGGGTGGTLSLNLLSTCAANQILKWSGTAWACAADANSGGTVTSVGLSAPSSDFTVSGTPITTNGTLALNWLVPPDTNNAANAIVKRDANGAFVAGNIYASLISSNSIAGSNSTNTEGVYGDNTSLGPGILGESYAAGANGSGYGPDGVDGTAHYANGNGIGGFALAGGNGVYGYSNGGWAGFFYGDVEVDGNLSKAAGSFKIDHPLDPSNKYLYHSFVESPDMMNIYNGNAALDSKGQAVVTLPDWFETLNRDFRYQLTAIGEPGPNLHIAEKIHGNTFRIAGGQPDAEVSWQVTGIRQDAWANAHRIPVEESKLEEDRGRYLHPELFGAPQEMAVRASRRPTVQKLEETRLDRSVPKGMTPVN